MEAEERKGKFSSCPVRGNDAIFLVSPKVSQGLHAATRTSRRRGGQVPEGPGGHNGVWASSGPPALSWAHRTPSVRAPQAHVLSGLEAWASGV